MKAEPPELKAWGYPRALDEGEVERSVWMQFPNAWWWIEVLEELEGDGLFHVAVRPGAIFWTLRRIDSIRAFALLAKVKRLWVVPDHDLPIVGYLRRVEKFGWRERAPNVFCLTVAEG